MNTALANTFSSPQTVDLDHVQAARDRLSPHIEPTPVLAIRRARGNWSGLVWGKAEYLNPTGSFKERGACHALLRLEPNERVKGAIAASAGNHALGLSYHGTRLGIPVTVVVPETAPEVKVANCRSFGARVVVAGATFAESCAVAAELAERLGLRMIHPFDDPEVIAGQGTVALEILEQVPELSTLVVPVGGAGLLAGVSVVMKALRPDVQIVAVEPTGAACFAAACAAGRPVSVGVEKTLADGLAVSRVGDLSFALARSRVDRLIEVGEQAIAAAVLAGFRDEKVVLEGAGAIGLAAVREINPGFFSTGPTVVIQGGGNLDPETFARIVKTKRE